MIEYLYFGALAIAGIQDMLKKRVFKILCWVLLGISIIIFSMNFSWFNMVVVIVEAVYILLASKVLKVGLADTIIWVSLCFVLLQNALWVIMYGLTFAISYALVFKKNSVPLIPFTILGLVIL